MTSFLLDDNVVFEAFKAAAAEVSPCSFRYSYMSRLVESGTRTSSLARSMISVLTVLRCPLAGGAGLFGAALAIRLPFS